MAQSLYKNCFLRSYDESSAISLPIISQREWGQCGAPLIFVPGEIYSFYIPWTGAPGSMSISNGSGTFNIGASFTGVPRTGGTDTIVDFTFPGGIPDGVYRVTLGGKASVTVEVINDINEAADLSAFFRVSHNKIIGGYFYPYIGANYKQRMRLRITQSDYQPEANFEGYEATNTGVWRNLQGSLRYYATFQTPEYSQEDHEAMTLLALHDNILINDQPYIRRPGSPYRILTDNSSPTSTGEFGLYKNDTTVLLKC